MINLKRFASFAIHSQAPLSPNSDVNKPWGTADETEDMGETLSFTLAGGMHMQDSLKVTPSGL